MITFLRAKLFLFSFAIVLTLVGSAMAHDPETIHMKILKNGQLGLFDNDDVLPFYTFDVSDMANVNWALASALSLEMPLNVTRDGTNRLVVGENGAPGYFLIDPQLIEVRNGPNDGVEFWFVKGAQNFKLTEARLDSPFGFNDALRETQRTSGLIAVGQSEKPFLTRWRLANEKDENKVGDPIHEWAYDQNPGGVGWVQALKKDEVVILKPRVLRRKIGFRVKEVEPTQLFPWVTPKTYEISVKGIKIVVTPEQKAHIEALELERGEGKGVILCVKARCPSKEHIKAAFVLMGRDLFSKEKQKGASKAKVVPSAPELPIYVPGWVPPQNPAYQNAQGPAADGGNNNNADYTNAYPIAYPSLQLDIAKSAFSAFSK